MEVYSVLLIFFQSVLSEFQYETSLSSIQISTCDVPLINTSFAVCCYTENLPSDMIINFFNNHGHVARISQFYILDGEVGMSSQRVNRVEKGNGSVYSLTVPNKFLQDYAGETFECGNYVNRAKTTIVVVDGHTTSYHLPGSSPQLYYKLQNGLTSNVRLYLLQSNVTLLEVDQQNNVTYHSDRIIFNGDVRQMNFSAKILKLQRQWNGTYVCEYTIKHSRTVRDGITMVVLGKPMRPEIKVAKREIVENEIFVHVTCDAVSSSAAPIFYKPQFVTDWMIPSNDDWPIWYDGFQTTTNGSSAYISNIVCNETSTRNFPWYCTVSEQSLISDRSLAFLPNVVCSNMTEDDLEGAFVSLLKVFGLFLAGAFLIVCVAGLTHGISSRQRQETPNLSHRLPTARDFRSDDVQRALEIIAMEESRQNYDLNNTQRTGTHNVGIDIDNNDTGGALLENIQLADETVSVQNIPATSEPRGAVGGAPKNDVNDDKALLKEVEALLERHHRHLRGNVVSLRVSRRNILENLIGYYTEEALATSRITVRFVGEEGMDCGGVTNDMFTTFWYRAQEEFFIGCEAVVPYLPPQRFTDDSKYRVLGRILSHSVAVMKEFPIHMCKSTIIAMIYETTDVSKDILFEDFLYFLDDHDRNLVTTAINDYSSLTSNQADELITIFERYEYAIRITADNFKYHVTQLARHVICIRPKPLLDKMRSGIPQSHLEHFWSNFHLKILSVLFRALRPTPERVIACLKTSNVSSMLTLQQTRVFGFLKDLLKEMTEPELETFLHFVTGKKSIPREKITIEFTTATGNLRLPKAHTCSSMMELPASYENYDTFRSELKHLLASDEALKMSMA